MHTPSHIILNLAALGRRDWPARRAPVALGAFAPDAPMFVFFAFERFGRGHTGDVLWSVRYYDPAWQVAFDLFNSLPIIAAVAVLAHALGRRKVVWACISAALHAVMDLPLHSGDGHRHFYPLSDFRFDSPVSYWDPAHYGAYAATAEGLAVVAVCVVVIRRARSRWLAAGLSAVVAGYVAMCIATWVWAARLPPAS